MYKAQVDMDDIATAGGMSSTNDLQNPYVPTTESAVAGI